MAAARCTTAFALVCAMVLAMAPPPARAQEDYLSPHNAARSGVGVGPMSWDSDVEAYAQIYADKRKGDCQLVHSGGPYGENIFWGSTTGFTAADAVASWVDEKQCYHYDSDSCDPGQMCGHYTQVVWRGSVKLGCARVECDGGRGVFITCNYSPPGNYVGQRPY